jgi:hypothetical protein
MAFVLNKTETKVIRSKLLGFLSPRLIFLSSNLGIDPPIDRSPNLIEGIHADTIASACDSNENATLFHNNNGLEGHSTDQGVRYGCGRGNEGYDVQTLGMA